MSIVPCTTVHYTYLGLHTLQPHMTVEQKRQWLVTWRVTNTRGPSVCLCTPFRQTGIDQHRGEDYGAAAALVDSPHPSKERFSLSDRRRSFTRSLMQIKNISTVWVRRLWKAINSTNHCKFTIDKCIAFSVGRSYRKEHCIFILTMCNGVCLIVVGKDPQLNYGNLSQLESSRKGVAVLVLTRCLGDIRQPLSIRPLCFVEMALPCSNQQFMLGRSGVSFL